MRIRLGVLTTHPIQYQVPCFRALAARPDVDLRVLYCMIPTPSQQGAGFGTSFQWDLPLLEGYRHETLENVSRRPSVVAFEGCDTPGVGAAIRRHRFDAVLVRGWVVKSCLQCLWACRGLGIPCLVRGESNALRKRRWWVRAAHRVLLRQYAALLAIGRANRDFYLRNGVPPGKIFSAPYCVDNDRFAAQAAGLRPRRNVLRRAWGIPACAMTFLFCGKFSDKKRPRDLLTALGMAVQAHGLGQAGIHLLMVGDGDLRSECERMARGRSLPVTFAGFLNQNEIARAYVASDCLVLPSDFGETWGLVVNEAMACGLPAIVSDRVGCRADLVRPWRTGAVFPFGDFRALADLLVSFAAAPAEVKAMGTRARELAAAYSIDKAVSGIMRAARYVSAPART